MEWYEIIIAIAVGLSVVIPLGINLYKWIKNVIKEKNWPKLVEFVASLMKEAEVAFDNGASRKEWVLRMVESASKTIDYPVDMEKISKLIDDLCEMSKIVNVNK